MSARVVLLLACVATAASAEKPRLLVMQISTPASLGESASKSLTDSIAAEISRRGFFQVLSSEDLRTLLGMERQKQLLGCADTATSCIAELAGATGAQLTLSGSLARLGDTFQLTLQTLDSSKGQPVGRTVRMARDLDTLLRLLPWAVADATATPPPPEPSRVLPITLLGAGAATVVAGGVIGYQALSADTALRNELELGRSGSALLSTGASYEARAAQVGQQRTLSLVLLGGGAALLAAGIVLMPSSPGGARVALVPGLSGAALVGEFP